MPSPLTWKVYDKKKKYWAAFRTYKLAVDWVADCVIPMDIKHNGKIEYRHIPGGS
jgi:hypothetical protein